MSKLNRYWLLKYSEYRKQLEQSSKCYPDFRKDKFTSSVIYEVSYPYGYKGPQVRYVGSGTCFDNFPSGCIITMLSSEQLSRLYGYYQIGQTLFNE